jgi:serine phosphatase RsbU (regulator of sigma subunit)
MNHCETFGPRLELCAAGKPGRVVPLGASGVQIGRDPTAGVRYEDSHISRQHARVEQHADGEFYLVDTSKHRATYLNGRRLLETRPVRLRDGDHIRVGDHEMVFRCESGVLSVEPDAGSTVLETLCDLTSDHLAGRARRPAETLKAVLNVNRSLGGGGDLNQVVSRALSSLMELFPITECGVIVTIERDGRLPALAIQHRDGPPPKLTLSRTILHQVIEQGDAVLIRDVATDERFSKRESVASLVRSALCVPLPGSDGRPVGMVQLGVRDDPRSRFTSEDLDLLAALALPIAATVENERLLRERAQWAAARDIQRALLPRDRPEISGYSFWECYRPALEVGGDSYDYISVARDDADAEPRWVVSVGDVSGKGMPAALLAAAVCPEIRHAARGGAAPAEVLSRVNRHVCEGGFDSRFVTMILVELDPKQHRLTLANAAHERPLVRKANGTVERLELGGTGLALGILAHEAYKPATLQLDSGEVLVLHSDGLTDARDRQGNPFGLERVMQVLSHAPAVASLVGEALLEAVRLHSDGVAPFDDLTIVCVGRD